MKMKFALITAVLAQMASSNMVVASLSSDTSAGITTDAKTNGYSLTVCITNSILEIGDDINVIATLKNISTNSVTIVISKPMVQFISEVKYHGKEAEKTEYAKSIQSGNVSSLKKVLAPNEQITESFPLSKFYRFDRAGEYEVTISRWIRAHNESAWKTIIAPPLKVTVNKP